MLEYKVSAKRVDAHGSLARCKDAEIVLEALDRAADRGGIDQQAACRRNEAAALDHPDEDLDQTDARTHGGSPIIEIFAFLA